MKNVVIATVASIVLVTLGGCASMENGFLGLATHAYVENQTAPTRQQVVELQQTVDQLRTQTEALNQIAAEAEVLIQEVEAMRQANATVQEQVAALQQRFDGVEEQTLRALVTSINNYLDSQ